MSTDVTFKFGIDVDGVLADFTMGYLRVLAEVSGGKRLLADGEEPPCWDWPQAVGYTTEEVSAAWRSIKQDHFFWVNLKSMPEVELTPVMQTFLGCLMGGHEVYFITNRMGPEAHAQTLTWMVKHGISLPTILIANELTKADGSKEPSKGYLAKALGLTHFIDDKPENCYHVHTHSPATKIFLLKHRWNDHPEVIEQCFLRGIVIVPSIREFFTHMIENPCPVLKM